MKTGLRYKRGDTIGGRYVVHQALMGGMSEVYLCLDLEANVPIALKSFQSSHLVNFIDVSGSVKEIPKLFKSEIATWIALENHPNIVRCFQLELLEGRPFIILEWVAGDENRGTDLRGWLRRIVMQMCGVGFVNY